MTEKQGKPQSRGYKLHVNNWKESKHTRNKFKEFLAKASYEDILKEYQRIKNLILILKMPRNRAERPQKNIESLKILQYKNSLLVQKLQLKTQRPSDMKHLKKFHSL